jgi:hypothetical protein
VPPGELAYAFIEANPPWCFFAPDTTAHEPLSCPAGQGAAVRDAQAKTAAYVRKIGKRSAVWNLLGLEAQIRKH